MLRSLIFTALALAGTTTALAQVVLDVANCVAATDVCALGGTGNADGSLDPGESGTFILSLTNTGTADATNVTATVSSSTPGVVVTQPNASFGTVIARGTKAGTPAIGLDIADSVPCGTAIQLDARIASDQGPFSGSCVIQVTLACTPCVPGPAVNQASCASVDTCALGGGGNNNGQVEPGESAKLTLSLTNTGTAAATNVTATVNTSTPGVVISAGNATFGNIAQGATVAGTPAIDYAVDLAVACGTMIDFQIDVRALEGAWSTSCQVQVPVVCTPCAAEPQLSVAACLQADTCALGGLGDGDGNVDPGESSAVTLSLTNSGQVAATNVTVVASTGTPGVLITQANASFGNIAPGATVAGTPTINYTVDASVPCATNIVIQLDIRSTQKGFAELCNVLVPVNCRPCVAAPVLGVRSCVVTTDTCALGGSGNANGRADPGEDINMTVEVENSGLAQATNVTVVVTSATPGVSVTQGNSSAGTIAASSFASATPTIDWSLASGVGCGTPVVFDVRITSTQGGTTGSCQVVVPASCSPCGGSACTAGGLGVISGLLAVRSGAAGATFSWQRGGSAVEYHVNASVDKAADFRQAPVGSGESRCTAIDPGASCLDATAISDSRTLLLYRVIGACGPAAADEGPM